MDPQEGNSASVVRNGQINAWVRETIGEMEMTTSMIWVEVARVANEYAYVDRTPFHTSALTGRLWMEEMLTVTAKLRLLECHVDSKFHLLQKKTDFRCSGGSVVLLDRTVHRPWHFRETSTSSAGQPCSSLPDGSLFCIPRSSSNLDVLNYSIVN
ncbi:hypothetical protein LOK49_LG01G01072 [Camellia lanceoleosa]|uniref:Uncharacterized protein n=1 Tax=Camellia lanceoleosa TaxID=1840588 RepID=A0ACC0IU29_9ERIC|nr:hypothetical protein LOK49_LG01G01072 [Camellia lanceoleosa]